MIDELPAFRNKEQVLSDLAKAFPFTPESLEANRKGQLSDRQVKELSAAVSRPAIMAFACFLAPILFWTGMTGVREGVSFLAALPMFFSQLFHLGQLIEAHGKMTAFAEAGTTAGALLLALFVASRTSSTLYADLLARKVVTKEGRVVAREEQIMRENGRDPIERYYLSLRTQQYPVNLATYRAMESGGVYLLYVLPRSEHLVALEPKAS